MTSNRLALATTALLLAACSQAPLVASNATAPAAAPQAVTVDLGAANGRNAELSVSAPAAANLYQLMTPVTQVHHWVAADITEYDVQLLERNADNTTFSALSPDVTVALLTSGSATKAVFQNLPQGSYYRAKVSAVGRKDGNSSSGPTAQLNSQAYTADTDVANFDFTGTQNVSATLNQSVTVHFDGVAFNGNANVSFASPADGSYVNPSSAPVATTAP